MTRRPNVKRYRLGFQAIEETLSPGHLAMLEAHYHAPNRTITVRQLATSAGYKGWEGAVLQYGLLAKRLCTAMSFEPHKTDRGGSPIWSYVLADSPETPTSEHWQWTLRPEVIKALGQLEWFDTAILPEEVQATERYLEGAVRVISVNAYERNRDARAKCIEHYGWTCAVCGYDMVNLYGKLGEGVIHVHHTRELAALGRKYEVNPVTDLRPVCPNCHAILHTRSPAMTIDQLSKLLSARKTIRWPAKS